MALQTIAKGLVLVGGIITLIVIPVFVIGISLFAMMFAVGFAEHPSAVAEEGMQVVLLFAGGALLVTLGLLVAWIRALRGKRISLLIVAGAGLLVGWVMGRLFFDWLPGDNSLDLMGLIGAAALGPLGMTIGALVLLIRPSRRVQTGPAAGAAPSEPGLPPLPPVPRASP